MPLLSVLIVTLFILAMVKMYNIFEDKIKFFAQGKDYGFRSSEISALWTLARSCGIEEPLSLYVSESAVNKCIATYIDEKRENGEENSYKVQAFMEKLYSFKKRIILEKDKRRGLQSSNSIDNGQKLSIILRGKGVFFSKVLNNGHELIVSLPVQINKTTKIPMVLQGEDWVDKEVSVYFWRKGDAAYAFDTTVTSSGIFRTEKALFLKHSRNLERTQKRQSIRCVCEIYGNLHFSHHASSTENIFMEEDSQGYKCLIEDISEDGAMVRIGGKAKNNVQIMLQFELSGSLVIMYGVVRAVEYNENMDQSRLHFECTKIEPSMRNNILSYVYNVIPQEQKEIYDAMNQASSLEESENKDENTSAGENGIQPPESEDSAENKMKKQNSEAAELEEIKDFEE